MRECEKLNIQDSGAHFEPVAAMNEGRSLFGYTLCKENEIYVVGGVAASMRANCTDTIEMYSILKNKWTILNVKIPQKLCGVSCVYFEDENKIKIFGGSDNLKKSSKAIYELNLKEGTLAEAGSMNSRKSMNNKVFRKNDMVHLIGGSNDSEYEIINLQTNSKSVFNYGEVMKGDLNNFCGFML